MIFPHTVENGELMLVLGVGLIIVGNDRSKRAAGERKAYDSDHLRDSAE